MTQDRKPARNSVVNPVPVASSPGLLAHYPDLDDWALSWRGSDRDIKPGQRIVACFRPFLAHLAATYARPTIRKHADNLWILGGEIIRDLNETPGLRRVPIEELLFQVVLDGGPLLYHRDSEGHLRSFKSTCHKFRQFHQRRPVSKP